MRNKTYERKDKFYKKAKDEGYVARSAYKILAFDKAHNIFAPKATVVDLGCAPGGWLQVAQKRMRGSGLLLGIDLEALTIPLDDNTHVLKADFLSPAAQTWLAEKIPAGADWVLSDMAPHLTGIRFKDQMQMTELCQAATEFCRRNLKSAGSFICKFFPNPELDQWIKDLKKEYQRVEIVKSQASRASSNECYVLCLTKKS